MDHPTDPTAEARLDQLRRELGPVGLLQTMLVEQIALAMGRLRRVDTLENPDDRAWVRDHAKAERSFYRSLDEFRRQARDAAKTAPIAAAVAPPPVAPTPPPARTIAPCPLPPLGPSLDDILSGLPPGPVRPRRAASDRRMIDPARVHV